MFNWPYKLRSQTSYLVPKPQEGGWMSVVETCVNGTTIAIKVPRNKSRMSMKPISPAKAYSLRNNDFDRYITGSPEWEYFPLISRWLDFNGPWFTGTLGRLGVFVGVVRQLNQAPEISLFHPRAFELTIAELMKFCHGNEFSRNNTVQDWFAPVDWLPLPRYPCIAARFDALANSNVRRSERRRYLFLPLTDYYLLQVSLPITRVMPLVTVNEELGDDTDAWISEEPMKALADQILDSLQVRLSPEAEQQQAKALERLSAGERGLVKEFPPLKWV